MTHEMTYEFITYEKRGRVAVVTLNRPDSMNALHLEAHLELKDAWEDYRDDPEVWVAILTGAGDRAFCAGNDLKVTADRTAKGGDIQGEARPPFGRITRDFDCPKPIIAAVNGVAAGGGLELILACDIVVASEHARMGLPEPKVGLYAGAGGAHRLARQIPFKLAMGMLLTGDLVDAPEAHRDRPGQPGGPALGADDHGARVGGSDHQLLAPVGSAHQGGRLRRPVREHRRCLP